MNERKKFYAYTYACDTHPVGECVRRVVGNEAHALESLAKVLPHATNCWIKGCQHPATQVRLVAVQKS